jgi:hypothetical protein
MRGVLNGSGFPPEPITDPLEVAHVRPHDENGDAVKNPQVLPQVLLPRTAETDDVGPS